MVSPHKGEGLLTPRGGQCVCVTWGFPLWALGEPQAVGGGATLLPFAQGLGSCPLKASKEAASAGPSRNQAGPEAEERSPLAPGGTSWVLVWVLGFGRCAREGWGRPTASHRQHGLGHCPPLDPLDLLARDTP